MFSLPKQKKIWNFLLKTSQAVIIYYHFVDSNIKLKSEKNSNSDSQEFIRLKDPVDNEDIIIRKKRSETMHYDIQRKIKSPPTLSIGIYF